MAETGFQKDLKRIFAEYANFFTLPVATSEDKGDTYSQLPRSLLANLMLKEAHLLVLLNKGVLTIKSLREDCDRFHKHAETDFSGKKYLEDVLDVVGIPAERRYLYLPAALVKDRSVLPFVLAGLAAAAVAYLGGYNTSKPPVNIKIDVPPMQICPPTATLAPIAVFVAAPTDTPVPYVAPKPKPRPKKAVRPKPVRKPVRRKPAVRQAPAPVELAPPGADDVYSE